MPTFETALRQAALNLGARYLNASRLFHGHEVCTDNTWARGLYIEIGHWDENAARQSFHPNYCGHGAFADCMTAFWNSGLPTATCVDPASTGSTTLVDGLMEFMKLRNLGTGDCVDGRGLQLPQPDGAAVVRLPRRPQPRVLVRRTEPHATLGAVPRPVPGRQGRHCRRW